MDLPILISITVNGERREVPGGLDVQGLLGHLEIPLDRVAVELNREIVRKAEWTLARVEEGASVEIVHFVGGGRQKP
jgi:thiamine biosynthesis protein ThiS